MLLISLTITGCSKTPSEDFYVSGTDFQYQYYDNSCSRNVMAQGNNAIYFSIGDYIYQLDEETETISPLCNKANCLHNNEIDKNKKSECNAYIQQDDIGDGNISYMDGFLYTITSEWKEDKLCSSLYKLAENGSSKDRIYQWDGATADNWCFHRNILYYVEHTYDENNQEFYELKEMKLTGIGKFKPNVIWKPDEDITVVGCTNLVAYGNHFYFNVDGAKGNNVTGLASEDDWIKYYYSKTFQYNLEDKTLSEIRIPDQTETQQVSSVTFWQDRIVFQPFDMKKNEQLDATADVYIADLNGSNAEVLLKDMPMYRSFSSDGNYLYVSNWSECTAKIVLSPEFQESLSDNTKWDYKVNVDIYDKNMNLVDSVEPPFRDDLPSEQVYGIGDRMYVQVEDESNGQISIQYWDKSKIGTYHGGEYQLTHVCDIEGVKESDVE